MTSPASDNPPAADMTQMRRMGMNFLRDTAGIRYTYNFKWLGVPIIQCPQDIVSVQEILWSVKPDVVIETGVAHGGSLILSASILALLGGEGRVIGVDIDIRPHNRAVIEAHPLAKRIDLVQGSAIDPDIVAKVKAMAAGAKNPLVILDSNHTHEHVMAELRAYAPLVRAGSYCIVMDTGIEDMPEGFYPNRPWNKTANPKTAVWEYLKECDRFEIDQSIQDRLLITVAPDGYLKCIKD
ncbi:MAG: cephalosporin hydroxylase [Planctomycetes bacterium]|nr:cephalosporin hydroxylase [Planctomycetota bacterium]